MIKAKFVIEAEVAFHEYPTKKLNRKAIVVIKQYIKEILNDVAWCHCPPRMTMMILEAVLVGQNLK